jgi:hypothetical protein
MQAKAGGDDSRGGEVFGSAEEGDFGGVRSLGAANFRECFLRLRCTGRRVRQPVLPRSICSRRSGVPAEIEFAEGDEVGCNGEGVDEDGWPKRRVALAWRLGPNCGGDD